MMTQTENTTASAGLPAALIVFLAEAAGAALLWALLTSETTAVVLTLLAVMGAGFALMQVRPQIEETIVGARRCIDEMLRLGT